MIFLADENLAWQVVRSLQLVQFDIEWVGDICPGAKDADVLELARVNGAILLSHDLGVPSQAYFLQFAQQGVTVVQLRWKQRTSRDLQEIVRTILDQHERWLAHAAEVVGIISVTKSKSRYRPWTQYPDFRR